MTLAKVEDLVLSQTVAEETNFESMQQVSSNDWSVIYLTQHKLKKT